MKARRFLLALACAAAWSSAFGQAYPNRTVKIVVPTSGSFPGRIIFFPRRMFLF